MFENIDINTPLKNYFNIPEYLHRKSISCLKAVMREDDRVNEYTIVIQRLQSAKFRDLHRLLNATLREIGNIRLMGYRRQVLLIEILRRISESPDSIMKYRIAPRIRKASKQENKQLAIRRIIRKHKKSPEEKAREAEAALKAERMKQIKQKLRDMGMIQ